MKTYDVGVTMLVQVQAKNEKDAIAQVKQRVDEGERFLARDCCPVVDVAVLIE